MEAASMDHLRSQRSTIWKGSMVRYSEFKTSWSFGIDVASYIRKMQTPRDTGKDINLDTA
jgi:hypothetical protein